MNRNVIIGMALVLILAFVAISYGWFGERLHNQDVNATKAVVTDQGTQIETPQRQSR